MPVLGWRTVAVLVAILAVVSYVFVLRAQVDHAKAELATFKRQVAEAAQKASEVALQRTIADEQRKEAADAEHAQALAALNARVASLRARRADSGFVPAAPAASSRPDLICFDRAEYQRTDGAFTAGARGLADEGTTATVDLDGAKAWAQGH